MPFALVGLVLAWAVMLLFGGMELDRGLLLLAYSGEREDVAFYARLATELGGAAFLLPLTAFGVGFLLVRRDWRAALLLAAITISGRLLVALQKDLTARIRPQEYEHLVEVQSLAFPSGHAANSTLVFLCLALLLPRTARARAFAIWAAVWLALLVGGTRVLLGVHWPSDVIGGWSFGLFWTLLLLRLSGRPIDEGTPSRLPHSSPKESDDGRQ